MSHHLRRSGWMGVARALLAKLLRRPLAVPARIPGARHPVRLRLRTSDLWTFDEIFERREYDVPLPGSPSVVIDAGANIGLASVYFALRFPEARILALEPEEENVALLRANTAPYPNIEVVQGALWHTTTTLELVDPGKGAWGFRAGEAGARGDLVSRVPAFSVPDLLEARGLDAVDVLKIDIEGAEREVFERAGSWMDRVDSVIVELHEELAPGCGDAFLRATADFEHRWEKGENQVAARERHPWPEAS